MRRKVTLYCEKLEVKGMPKAHFTSTGIVLPKKLIVYEGWFYPQQNVYQIATDSAIFTFAGLNGKDHMLEYSFIDIDTINIEGALEQIEDITNLLEDKEKLGLYMREGMALSELFQVMDFKREDYFGYTPNTMVDLVLQPNASHIIRGKILHNAADTSDQMKSIRATLFFTIHEYRRLLLEKLK